jgi:hypothetical protein
LEGDEDCIYATDDDNPLRYCIVDDILGDQAVMPESVQRNIDVELHLTHTGEPCSLVEAGRATSRLIAIRTTTRMINRVLVVWSFT